MRTSERVEQLEQDVRQLKKEVDALRAEIGKTARISLEAEPIGKSEKPRARKSTK